MRQSFRNTMIATTVIMGLTTFAATAAPPLAGDPTAVRPASGQSMMQGKPGAGHNGEAKVEQRIKDLHAKLAISSAQQAQWDDFVQVMRDNARSMEQTFRQREHSLQSMTATENMQSYAQVATEHAQEMQKLVPAFQALYATMSDNQKMTADQVFRADASHRDHPRHG